MLLKLIPFFIAILFSNFLIQAQNFILPDGEYMDTATNAGLSCKDYGSYYYQVAGKYPQSSSTLLKKVQAFIKSSNRSYPGDGYITFRFIIDCGGKPMPRVQVLQTDEKYIKYHFDKEFVAGLFSFFKTLDKWKIARTKEGEPFLYRAFITFKIKNGKVINIIP